MVLTIISGFVMVNGYIEGAVFSFILPVSQCEMNWTASERGMLSGAVKIGMISSAYVWGYLADTKGRRTVMLPTLFISSALSILSSLSKSFEVMFMLKLTSGIG